MTAVDAGQVEEALLSEGFCPLGHGPLARSAHPEFYAWCHTCRHGWGITAVYHGTERVDVETTTAGLDSHYPGGAGPAPGA